MLLNQDRTESFSRQDGNSIGQDWKCNRQTVDRTGRFPGGQSLDTET